MTEATNTETSLHQYYEERIGTLPWDNQRHADAHLIGALLQQANSGTTSGQNVRRAIDRAVEFAQS